MNVQVEVDDIDGGGRQNVRDDPDYPELRAGDSNYFRRLLQFSGPASHFRISGHTVSHNPSESLAIGIIGWLAGDHLNLKRVNFYRFQDVESCVHTPKYK